MAEREGGLKGSDHDVTGSSTHGAKAMSPRETSSSRSSTWSCAAAAARLRHEPPGTSSAHRAGPRGVPSIVDQRTPIGRIVRVLRSGVRDDAPDPRGHARRRKMAKRSGGWARVTLDEAAAQRDPPDVDLLDLDAALSELASFDPRKSRVVELRFFGGLSFDDSAQALGISRATVERDWHLARLWLYRRVTHGPDCHDT